MLLWGFWVKRQWELVPHKPSSTPKGQGWRLGQSSMLCARCKGSWWCEIRFPREPPRQSQNGHEMKIWKTDCQDGTNLPPWDFQHWRQSVGSASVGTQAHHAWLPQWTLAEETAMGTRPELSPSRRGQRELRDNAQIWGFLSPVTLMSQNDLPTSLPSSQITSQGVYEENPIRQGAELTDHAKWD